MSKPMTDAEIIAWARRTAEVWDGGSEGLAEKYRRLADLAEKGAGDWQPIATAPENVDVLVWDAANEFVMMGHHRKQRWYGTTGMLRAAKPTHWRPLPAPPGGER